MRPVRRAVLHVDDDPQLLRIVSARLGSQGYEVISLSDPTRTIATLLEHNCRLVILDVEMPQSNGLEVLSQIKEFDGGVQVIMLTGLVSMNCVLESMRRGAEACHFKPVLDYTELIASLDAAFIKVKHWWQTLQELVRRRQDKSSPTSHSFVIQSATQRCGADG